MSKKSLRYSNQSYAASPTNATLLEKVLAMASMEVFNSKSENSKNSSQRTFIKAI